MLHLGRKMTWLILPTMGYFSISGATSHRWTQATQQLGWSQQAAAPGDRPRRAAHSLSCTGGSLASKMVKNAFMSHRIVFFFFGTWKMMACLPSQYASASYLRNCVVTGCCFAFFPKSCCGWEEHWKCLTDVSRQLYWVRSLALWCSPARVTGAQRGESLATHWHSTDTFWILCKPPHVWDLALFAGCYLLQSGEEEISTNTSWNKFFS